MATNQLISLVVGLLLVLIGDYTESAVGKYDCGAAKYESNPLLEFVQYCAPPAWGAFFTKKKVQEDLNELTPLLLKEAQKKSNPGIEPPMPLMFEAFNMVAPQKIRVVIIGQDPTPQPGQATGLAFSVGDPKSVGTVLNVLLEVAFEGFPVNLNNGDLKPWALQGVLLLNSALTVNRGQAGSHLKLYWWISFTELLVEYVSINADPSVWLLWGNEAQYFQKFIDRKKHYVMTGGHPSALGGIGRNEFFGKGYFQCANEFLANKRDGRIDWSLAPRNVLETCPPM